MKPKRPPKEAEETLFAAVHVAVDEGRYVILPHARDRCRERSVDDIDVEYALRHGRRVKARDRYDETLRSWSYAFEGETLDERILRVVVVLLMNILGVVTVVILTEEGKT